MSDDTAVINLRWAMALVEGLVGSGIARVVISPGSRSTPLALAFLHHPRVRTWVQVDERSAAFFALGLAKADRQPVALVCTSGSAPANWFPAVIEAGYGKTPLILLTADRPPDLRDCGANQTIDQVGLFGSHVRASHELPAASASAPALAVVRRLAARATDQSRWPLPGPVHINVPLHEPLVPVGALPEWASATAPVSVSYPAMSPPQSELSVLVKELSGRPGLIVCGEDVYGEDFSGVLARLAEALSCPVLADPLANLRFGSHDRSHILGGYDAFLRRESFAKNNRPEWVLRFGAMPVSRQLQRYLADCTAATYILVEPYGRWPDPLHQTRRLLRADPTSVCSMLLAQPLCPAPSAWLESFLEQERRAVALLGDIEKPLEAEVIESLLKQMGSGSCLFGSNSMAIRDLDSFATGGDVALRIVGNRGASGIDGNVSTALGLAAGLGKPVTALLGDLAFYHDMNGLLAARDANITLVVINNDGGGIFGYLPQAGLADFERAWLTPTGLDFSLAARMYGLNYRRVENGADFDAAYAEALAHDGPDMIEVPVDREGSAARHRTYWAVVSE